MGGRRHIGVRCCRWTTRSPCLLLLLVLALAGVEYLIGIILLNRTDEYAFLRSYFYEPIFNGNQPNFRNGDKSITWPKPSAKENATAIGLDPKNTAVFINKFNITHNETENTEVITERQDLTGNATVQPGEKESPAYIGTPMFKKKIMKGLHNLVTMEEAIKKTDPPLPLCAKMPPDLGPIPVNKTDLELDIVDKKFPEIQWGGRYTPPNCTARHKVAIIVPYRDRQKHLAIFLNHMHPFLMKQQIEYGIFIIEQEGSKDFNRAKVKNVGFVESQRLDSGWQCFVFHDIDLLPLDTRNLYSCPRQPRHMSASIDIYDFKIRYDDIFGGVTAMTKEQFIKVNGFSNKYWGWGAEDDDMWYRLKKVNYHVARYNMSIARYATLDHKKCMPNPKRYQLLVQTSKTFQIDGLSTLEYELVKVAKHHLYTHVLANIDVRTKDSLSKYIHHVFRQALIASATLLSITILYIMYLSTIDKYLFSHTETNFLRNS